MAYTEKQKKRIPELLVDLADHARVVLQKAGADENVADELSWRLAQKMGEHWGGQNINFPRGYQLSKMRRDVEIYLEFNGNNCNELARKYKLSVQQIYMIIKEQRKEYIDKRQASLDL